VLAGLEECVRDVACLQGVRDGCYRSGGMQRGAGGDERAVERAGEERHGECGSRQWHWHWQWLTGWLAARLSMHDVEKSRSLAELQGCHGKGLARRNLGECGTGTFSPPASCSRHSTPRKSRGSQYQFPQENQSRRSPAAAMPQNEYMERHSESCVVLGSCRRF
jgi:hypothetical protein